MDSFMQLNSTEKDLPFVLFYDYGSSVVPNHWHKQVEIIYSIKGYADVVVNNHSYRIPEGDAVIINSGDIHYFNCTKNHERVVIFFDFDIIEDTQSHSKYKSEIKKRLGQVAKCSLDWDQKYKNEFGDIIVRLTKLRDSKIIGRDLAIKARIYDLLLLICNRLPLVQTQPNPLASSNIKIIDQIERVVSFVGNNYMNNISLADAAKELNFATSYFARLFKKCTGTTFLAYLNLYRINRAQWLLLNKNCSVTDISNMVGFQSAKTFDRVFKAVTGISPIQYKKSIIENK